MNFVDAHIREIVGTGSIALTLKILGAVLTFGLHLAIGRLLGPVGAGTYFLIIAIVTFVALLARLGMDHSVTRLVATSAEDAAWSEVRGVVRNAVSIAVLSSIGLGLIVAFVAEALAGFVFEKPHIATPLRVMTIAVVPLSLTVLYSKALQGLKRVGSSTVVDSVVLPVTALPVLMWLTPEFRVYGAIIAYLAGATAACIAGMYAWTRSTTPWRQTTPQFSTRILLRDSTSLLTMAVFQQVALILPVLMLGVYATERDIGIFGAAQRTAALVGMILIAANSIIAPKFAALFHLKDFGGLESVTRQGALLLTIVSAPPIIVFLVAPELTMGLFGPGFSEGALPLRIMAVGQMVNVMTGSVGFLLIMTGQSRSILYTTLFMVFLNLSLCILLIPTYSATGAAIAAAVSLGLTNLLRVYHVWRTLGIVSLPFIARSWQKA